MATRDSPSVSFTISVRISRPCPSTRVLASEVERATALDFEVRLDVGGRIFEGEVSLCQPPCRDLVSGIWWTPCKSSPIRSGEGWHQEGWIHGDLITGIEYAVRTTGPHGVEVQNWLARALSGWAWPRDVAWRDPDMHPEVTMSITADPAAPHPHPATASQATEQVVFVVVGELDESDLDQSTHSYCVRAYRDQGAAEDHARRAGELSARAQAYPWPSWPVRSESDHYDQVHAAVPGLRELDPAWKYGNRRATTYRVDRIGID